MHKWPSHPHKPLNLGHKISEKYVLGAEVGRGAFGTVYECQNTKTGETVAAKRISVKDLNADQLNALEEEVSLLKNLDHANIVKYIGTVRTRNHLHILLEYMENGSLLSNIKKFGVFSPELVALFTRQVLQGLAYLHDQGVIHRDIKGANILTTKSGRVKLADFGVATHVSKVAKNNASNDVLGVDSREKSGSESEGHGTVTDDVVGTPYWMAPEVIEMLGASTACDVWSVACTVIELLTGKPPYYDVPPMAALYRIVQDEAVPLPPNLDPELQDFLRKCFVKTPALRATAVELLEHPWIVQSRKNQTGNSRGSYGEESEELVRRASLTIKSPPDQKSSVTAMASSSSLTNDQTKSKSSITSNQTSQTQIQQPAPAQKKSSVQIQKPTDTSLSPSSSANSPPNIDYDSDNNNKDGNNMLRTSLPSAQAGGVGRNSAAVRNSLSANGNMNKNPQVSGSLIDVTNNKDLAGSSNLSSQANSSLPVSAENKTEPQEEVVEDWDIEFGFNFQEGADSNLGLGQAYAGPLRVNKLSSPNKSEIDSVTGTQLGSTALNISGAGATSISGAGPSAPGSSTSISQLQPAHIRALKGSGPVGLSQRGADGIGRTHLGPLSLPSNRYRQSQRAFKPMSPLVEVQILGFGKMDAIDLDTVFEGDAPYGESGNQKPVDAASSTRSLLSQNSEHAIRTANSVEIDRKGSDPQVSYATNQGPLARYRESDLDSDFHKINLSSNNNHNAKSHHTKGASTSLTLSSITGRRNSAGSKKPVSKRGSIEDESNVANELRRRLSKLPQNITQTPNSVGSNGIDPFNSPAFENEQKSGSLTDDIRDEESLPKRVNEVLHLVSQLRPATPNEEGIIQACNKLCEMFEEQPKLRRTLLTHHGVIPIMEALEFEAKNPKTIQAVLRLVASVSEGDRSMQEVMAMAGIIPIVVILTRPEMEMETRLYAAEIVKQFIESSGTTLQMFVACGGLPVFANLLQPQIHQPQEMTARQRLSQTLASSTPDVGLALVALSGIRRVFRLSDASIALPPLTLPRQRLTNNEKRKSSGARHGITKGAPKQVSFKPALNDTVITNRDELADKPYVRTIPRNDVCRLFIRTGLLDRVAILLDHIRTQKGEKECNDADIQPIRLMKETASVLLVFSLGNTYVKQHLASAKIMRSIVSALADLWVKAKENTKAEREAETAKTLLKCIKNLSIEQTTLDVLERAGAIQALVSCLTVSVQGTYLSNPNISSNPNQEHEARPSVVGALGSSILGLSSPVAPKKRTTITEPSSKKPSQVESTLAAAALPKKGSMTSSKAQKGKDNGNNKGQILRKNMPATFSGSSAQEIHNMVILSMYYLTRLKPSRQEQAAACGIVPFLKATVSGPSPVKTFALQMLCDLAHTSAFTRFQLWREGVVDFFLDLLVCGDVFWEEKVLGALEVWLKHATPDVERAYLRPFSLVRLVAMFQSAQKEHFEYVSKVLLDMVTISHKLAESIGRSGFFMAELAARLSYPKPEVRINLLKLLRVICEHSASLETLVLEHNLYAIVTSIAKDKSRVVVNEVANQLLDQWKYLVDFV